MPRPTAPYRTARFLGASDDNATELPADSASAIRNLYRDRGKLVGRKGTKPHNDRDIPGSTTDLDGLFWARIGTTEMLYAVSDGDVFDTYPPVPPYGLVNGTDKMTPGLPVSFAWIDQKVYAGDGTLPNVRLTATRVDQAMLAAPGVATATVTAGGALPSGVTYSYKVVFLSADGNESGASAAFSANTATSAGNQQITLTSIPTAGSTTDCSGRRIYRTTQGGTTYRLVTTISDNLTTTYLDNTADASLGDAISIQDRSAFPPCALLIAHESRLIGARSAATGFDKQTLYISNFREPWWNPAAPDLTDPNQGTQIALQGPAAGEITGIASHGDRVYVFTYTHVFVLIGDQPLDYSLKEFAKIGCVSHRTIQSVRGRLLWLAADGVYEARPGFEVRRVSKQIDTFLKGRTAEQLAAAHAFVWDDRYYLCFPDQARYLDLAYEAEEGVFQWGELTQWTWNLSTVAYASGTRRPRLFAGREGARRVWELEVDEDDNGTAVPCVYTSPQWDLGNPGREKRIHYVGATFALGEGTASVALSKGTGAVIETFSVDLETPTETGGAIVRLFQRACEDARSERFQVSVSHSKEAAFEMLDLDGMWTLAT